MRQHVPHGWNHTNTLTVSFLSQCFEKLPYMAGVGSSLSQVNIKRE